MKKKRSLLLLLALAGLPFLSGLLDGRVFFRRDVHLMWYTQVEALVAAVGQGSWPLWNPYIAFGQPLWADANTQPLYPTTLLHFVVRPWTWYSLYVVLHLWLAGAGMAVLLRRMGASAGAALVGAAVLMASGPFLSLVESWNQLAGAAWMPWAAACALAALRRPRWRHTVAWSLCLAAPVLAGSPEGLLMGFALSAACAWARFDRRPAAGKRQAAATVASTVVLAALLSAGQWLPSLEAASRSARSALSDEARAHWSIQPAGMLQMAVPVPFVELPLRAELRQRLFGGRDSFLASLYLGLPALALAMAPWCPRTRRRRLVLGVLVVGAVLFSLGPQTPLFTAVTSLVPGLQSLRYPAKAMALAASGWALLVGLGFDDLRRRASLPSVFPRLAAAGLLLAALAAAWLSVSLASGASLGLASMLTLPADSSGTDALRPLLWASVAFASTAAAMAVALLSAQHGARPAILALAVVPLADLHLAHRGLNAMAPASLFTARPQILPSVDHERRVLAFDYHEPGASVRHLGRDNPYVPVRGPAGWPVAAVQALALREVLFPPSAGAWKVLGSFDRDVSGFGSDHVRLWGDLLRGAEGHPESYNRMLRLGAVGTVVSLHEMEQLEPVQTSPSFFAEPVRVYRVPGAARRTYVAQGLFTDRPEEATRAPDFDLLRQVVLPSHAGPAHAPEEGSSPGTSRVAGEGGDSLRLEVDAARPAFTVVVDAFDPHWRAYVDGQPATVLRANGAFRAVAVPAGRHVVNMVYRPWPVFVGVAVTLCGALFALALWLRDSGQRRKSSPSRIGSM
jgi:hypothetical protein